MSSKQSRNNLRNVFTRQAGKQVYSLLVQLRTVEVLTQRVNT